MVSNANGYTSTLSTNFNVSPYYDDFNEEKNIHRILFRPGLAVQARELTQMQTIIQNQIDRFASHIFQEGATVTGFEMNLDVFYHYVKLRNNNSTGTSINAAAFLNKTVKGSVSGVRALVVNVNDGSEANTPNFKTLFVKYISANTTSGYRYFANNEILTDVAGSGLAANTITSTQGGSTGYGLAATFNSGIIFAKDHFIRVPAQTVILSKYNDKPSVRVGFDVVESIITEVDDTTLLDPASGSYNYAAPGAARLKLTVNLKSIPLSSTVSNTFVELMQVKNGIVQSISNRTRYSQIRDYIAQRTYDESGDYIVQGLGIKISEHLKQANNQGIYTSGEGGNSSLLVATVEPGKAYIKGYDNEFIVSSRASFEKATDYASVESAKALVDYGNYVIVDNVVGQWDVNRQGTVSLRSQQANAVSQKTFSLTTFPGSEIGSARVRGIEYYSGTPGTPSAQYKLYLTDIKMSAGYNFSAVQSIGYSAASANGKADILSSNGTNTATYDNNFDRAIFRLPARAVRRLRDTSGNVNNDFSFYKSFDISFNTSGVATINTSDASETFDGAGILSDDATRTDFYVVARGTSNTAILTGTVTATSGSNTVSGTGTKFLTQVNPGDLLHVSNNTDYIVSQVVSDTSLKILSNATASRTGVRAFKRFKPGMVLDLGGVGETSNGTSRTINVATTVATLELKERLGTALTATAVVKLNKIDGGEAEKAVIRNRLVQINVGAGGGTSYIANTTGPWPLGLADGFRLVSVRKKVGTSWSSTTEGTDVTSNFTLDSGMTDNYYGHAKLVKKSTSALSIASGDTLLVTFDHFTHSYSTGVGYFSVDSYPVDDATAGSDTSKIFTYQIPIFTSQTTGETFDLRDCIDIRPRLADSANSVTALTNISKNPKEGTSFDLPAGGIHFSPTGEDFTTDLDYYLKRTDIVSISKDGKVQVTRGVPSDRPATPPAPADAMALAVVQLAPYPSLPIEIGRRYDRPDLSNNVRKVRNERYTMRDIGTIRDRIDRLEYYTALNLLEKNTKDLLVPDENGLDRFKNGILVDSFTGHNIGNVHDQDYKVAIDPQAGEMRPRFTLDSTSLFYTSNSSNVVRTNVTPAGVSKDQTITLTATPASAAFVANSTVTSGGSSATVRHKVGAKLYVENATGTFAAGASISDGTTTATISSVAAIKAGDLVTLPYTHKILIQQPYATTTRNCVGTAFQWRGNVILDPDSDIWYDTTQRPDTNINIDLNTDNWIWLADSWATQWNAWQTTFVGTPILTQQRDVDVGNQFEDGDFIYQSFYTESTFVAPTTEVRTGNKAVVNVLQTNETVGQYVTDVNIQPFMRSRPIFFRLLGMKTSSRLYTFFDGIDVSAYITPLTKAEYDSRLKTASGTALQPAASEGSALESDSNGDAYGIFRLPNDDSLRFRTGTKRIRFVDNPTNSIVFGQFTTSAETDYTAEGLKAGVSDLTVSTKRPVIAQQLVTEIRSGTQVTQDRVGGQRVVGVVPDNGCGGSDDPIAQTMLISALLTNRISTTGMYLTKIDVFFATKDSTLPIVVELREVDPTTGAITPKVVPFSRVVIPSADVNVNPTSPIPTPVIFPSPVYVAEDKEYAVVLLPGGVNPNYNVWTAVLGANDILTGGRVTEQPATGFMFTSANQRVWVPVENEDLMFTAYYAEFSNASPGNLIVKNEPRDYFTISDATGGFLKVGEVLNGETVLKGTFAPGSGLTGNVASSNSFVQGMVSGATGIITKVTTNEVRIRNVSTSAKFKGKEAVRFRLGGSATTSPLAGNSTGVIYSATTPTGRVSYYDTVNYANTRLYIANVAYSNSGPAYANAGIFKVGTYVRGQTNGYAAKIVTSNHLVFDNINLVTGMILPSNTNVSAYAKFATSNTARDSAFSEININNNTDLTVPRYIWNKSSETILPTFTTNKSAEIKYELNCDNIVASPAIDLRRLTLASTHNLISSNAAIGSSEDWVKFGGNSETRYISRTVTLADGQDAEDLRVYLSAYKPSGSDVKVYAKLLSGYDNDPFGDTRWIPMERNADQGFTSLSKYSSSENKNDFIEYVYDLPNFPTTAILDGSGRAINQYGSNNATGIFEYRNSAKARYENFKYFAIKVVLTNNASTNPPRVRELRAIALQV